VTIAVRPVRTRADRAAFIEVPYALHGGDPHWVPPLRFERRELLDPRKNPFFEHGEAELFVAWRGGRPVGRISAQLDRLHHERHDAGEGFFGFFDAPDDPDVVAALWRAAEAWHRERGHRRVLGPFSFTINGEMGVLVDGFDSPPFLMMNHNPPYYGARLEALGLRKAKDVFAWRYVPGELNEATRQIAEYTRGVPGLRLRPLDARRMDAEVRTVMTIFNEAWSNNWGYLPFTERELAKMAQEFRLLLDPRVAFVAEIDGEPAAMALSLPNLNEAIADLKGSLFPTGLAKLLWRVKVRGLSSLRLVLLGIRPKFRGRPELKGLSVLLYVETHQQAVAAGYHLGELSWTLEDNDKINQGIRLMGGEPYKTYRVYTKALD
jgi:hypothetical protein